MKVIEIIVRVVDSDGDEKWDEDSGYEAERICLSFEEHDKDHVYSEADEIKETIQRLVTA